MGFFGDPASWVLVSFLLFIALLIYLKVPAMAAKALDDRAAKIAKELEEARKLREEAQALLDSYKAKRGEAEREAADIVAQAKTDAEEFAAESRRKLSETIERRSKQAEQKIAQAEAAATKDVRDLATELAVKAASRLSAEATKGARGAKLVDESIAAIKSRLN
ncbi:MAG: F0F1 ATP synthase subunit B [Rhizobiales bacterium]|nr:F0F1 ATP synthase subunit B [Hyphomicrobiales bacterium]